MLGKEFGKTLFCIVSCLLCLLAGCSEQILPLFNAESTPALTPTASSPTPTTPQPTTTLPVDPKTLTIWVPPQFDPLNGTPAGNLMKSQMAAFEKENPEYRIAVRVKALNGPAGLMESLQATSAAAPLAMPSLVALSRPDLETATLRGLIVPVDYFSSMMKETDWYDYARELSTIQNSVMGLPFAGDAPLIAYRPVRVGKLPANWEDALRSGQPFVFPADDPQGMLALTLYLSKGGKLRDDVGRPVLDEKILTEVLTFFARGYQLGLFPTWTGQYQTHEAAWQAYSEGRAQIAIAWSSQYLATLPPDTSAAPLYSLGENNIIPANGWMWAIADPLLERRSVASHLAEKLVESQFLSGWTSAAGYLPTRPSSLAAWKNPVLQSLANQIIPQAHVQPPNDIIMILGPVLRDATIQVVKNQADPIQTAKKAVEKLSNP